MVHGSPGPSPKNCVRDGTVGSPVWQKRPGTGPDQTSPTLLSTSHTINQNNPFVWEKTFQGWVQGHDTSESWHETRHLLTSHYVKIPHYRITRNHSHWTTSLIQRRVMSWRDARGLEEWHGCYGRKSFYCSEPALLNDDDNDKEETLGEYVQSTKQLKKIGNELRYWEQEGSNGIDNRDVSPLDFDGCYYDSFSYDQQTFF